jgi:hypothetical protein
MSNSISTLLLRNLNEVFGENDPVRRRAANRGGRQRTDGRFTILEPSLETPVEWQHGVRRHPTPGGH